MGCKGECPRGGGRERPMSSIGVEQKNTLAHTNIHSYIDQSIVDTGARVPREADRRRKRTAGGGLGKYGKGKRTFTRHRPQLAARPIESFRCFFLPQLLLPLSRMALAPSRLLLF